MKYASGGQLKAWRFGASLLALAVAGVGCAEAPSEELSTSQSAILDGTRVSPAAYPAVGMVWSAVAPPVYTAGTGTLIGDRYVITAAHVVSGQWANHPPNVYVEFDTGTGKVQYPVESIYIHPSYLQAMKDPILGKMWEHHSKEGMFDVALLILSQAPAGIAPVALSTAVPTISTPVSFLGYGRLATWGATPVVNDARALYRGTNTVNFVDQTYLDTNYTVGTSGTYSGDSGGPLLIGSSIAAVTTFVGGYSYGSLDVFTRLDTIQPWIAGLMPGGSGMFAPDVYESTEQTRPPFALSSSGSHYSEPRSFTGGLDVDQISFRLDSTSHVRISCPHHFDWTVPFPTATVTKDGAPVSIGNPNASLYEGDLGPGTYVVTVHNNYSRGLSYTLGISTDGWFVQGDPYEPDGLDRPVHQVNFGEVSDHSIMPANDEDNAAIVVTATSNVRVETLPLSGNPDNDRSADTVVTLVDGHGATLAYNDDKPGSGSYCSFIEQRLDPGTYYLKIGGYMGNQVGYYGLRVTTY